MRGNARGFHGWNIITPLMLERADDEDEAQLAGEGEGEREGDEGMVT